MNIPLVSPGWDHGMAGAWAEIGPAVGGIAAQVDGSGLATVAVAGLAASVTGLLAWWLHARKRRAIEQRAEARTLQMAELIEHARCMLWEAEVLIETDDWAWNMQLHPSVFCRQLMRGRVPGPRDDLWAGFQVDTREEMDERAWEAIHLGRSGYEQEFRAVREGVAYWLHENVSITRLGPERYRLVGLVTDITAQREAEAARRQSELTLERILANAQCMIWRATVIEQEGRLEWPHFDMPASQLSALLFGGNWGARHNRGLWDNLDVADLPEMNRRSGQAMRSGAPGYEQRFRVVNRAGRAFWLNERVSISRIGDQVWSLVGVVTDITAQVEAEEARARSERRLSHLLERADTLIWQAKVERAPGGAPRWTMFIPPSQLYRRLFAAEPVNAVGFAWRDRGVPEQAEMEARCNHALETGAPGYEQVFRVPEGDGYTWLSESVTISPAGLHTWDLVGVITDITARRHAEEAWQASQERLRNLLDLADCMVWEASVVHRPNDVLEWDQYIPPSALYRRIFGEPGDQPLRLRWEELQVPEYPDMVARTLEAVKTRASGYEQEFHVVQGASEIWLREVVTLVHLGEGRFRMVGVIIDITPQRQAEAERRSSELRLGELLSRADCLVWESTVELLAEGWKWERKIQPSLFYRRLTGAPLPPATESMWPVAHVPERSQMDERCRAAILEGRTGYEQVFRFLKNDGTASWVSENVTIQRVDGRRYWLVGVAVDVTAQREAETARRRSEERLEEILARADCLLWEATVGLQTDAWTWEFKIQPSLLGHRLYGKSIPFVAEGLWRRFDIPEREEMNERCRRAMLEGRAGYEQVFRIVLPGSRTIWIRENVTIRRLADHVFSLVGVAVDITAQRGAEEALANEKERLAVTLRAMSESVITTDTTGRVQFMNPAAGELLECSAADGAGRQIDEICRLEGIRTGKGVPVPYARVAQGDVMADLPPHTQVIGGKGRRRVVEGCCAPIHAADSTVTGTVLVLRDVTEQERLEQELVRASRLESVGVLAGGIAHDFNNILTAVMGNLTLAQLDIPPDSPATASLRSAEKAALRARDLTQQLLTFAKGGEPVRAALQLETVVREMVTFSLHGSQVRAHYDMAPDLWPADADKGQIGRVVQNLVINAVQAMPGGGSLRIAANNDPQGGAALPGLPPGDYIRIAISDTGEGIKPENLVRIFDPYFTTKQTGSGLGLAAVYSIIKKHRGHIEVESKVGRGTTFRLWLPALRDRASDDEGRDTGAGVRESPLKGRVLFMDDEEIIRVMAVALLRRFGLEVECAADGAEAVEKYREALGAGRRYDLVIMDLTVPGGLGGLPALDRLRELDPGVKAVVSSGYSSDPVLANYRAHGFAAMVAKPYEVGEIAGVLREMLGGG